jgi:hypothetical protein
MCIESKWAERPAEYDSKAGHDEPSKKMKSKGQSVFFLLQ